MTAKAKLEVIASRLEARVPSWRPALPGYKSTRKNTRQSKLEVLASGWRPGYQVGGQCYKVTRSAKAHEAQDSKVGGQSSGWRPKFRLENPLQSWEAYLQTCRVV